MLTCPMCGNHNDDRHNFCGQCGTRVANVCAECQFANLIDQKFCGGCGKQLLPDDAWSKPTAVGILASQISTQPEDLESPEISTSSASAPVISEAMLAAINEAIDSNTYQKPQHRNAVSETNSDDLHSETAANSKGLDPHSLNDVLNAADEFEASSHTQNSEREIPRYDKEPDSTRDYIPEIHSEEKENSQVVEPALSNISETVPQSGAALISEALNALKEPIAAFSSLSDENEEQREPFPYKPPVFGQHRGIRQAAINYESVLPHLTHDFETFIGKGKQASGQVLLLCTSDGLGKSNLILQARQKADPIDPNTGDQQLLWFGAQHYRCFSPNRILLQGWMELLQNLIGLSMEGSARQPAHQQIKEFLQSLYQHDTPSPTMESFLLDLFGVQPLKPLDTDSLSSYGMFAQMMGEILRRLATIRPLALVFEDIQFADIATLAVLTQLLEDRLLQQSPILLVLTHSRDFYLSGQLEQTLNQLPYKEYVVSDLNDTEMEQFLNEGPLGGRVHEFPVPLLTTLIEYGHGLPIYLEELLRLLYGKGIVTLNEATGKFLPGDLSQLSQILIPNSLPELLDSRLSALSSKARYVLQLASVIGERFAVSLLMSLSQDTESEFNATLNELFNHGLLLPDSANTGRFRHGLIWRSIYNQMDPELKTQLHQLVSQVLENDFNQAITVNVMLMAHHAEQGQLLNRALNYWETAGVLMAQVGNLVATNHAMFRAMQLISLLESKPELSGSGQHEALQAQQEQLRLKLGMLNCSNNPELTVTLLKQLIERYRESYGKQSNALIEPFGYLATAYETQGNLPMALACVEESVALINKQEFPLEYAGLLTTEVGYLLKMGHLEQARQILERDISPTFASQPLENEPDYLKTYLNAQLFEADIQSLQCDVKAIDTYDQCLTLATEKNFEGLAISAQLAKTRTYLKRGEYVRCDEAADTLLNQIEALDEPDWFFSQWGLLAMEYHLALGDWDSTRQLTLAIVSRAEGIGDFNACLLAQLYDAWAMYQQGQSIRAISNIEQYVRTAIDYRFTQNALQGCLYLIQAAMEQQDYQSANTLLQSALEVANQTNIRNLWMQYQLMLLDGRSKMQSRDPNEVKQAGKSLEKLWPNVIESQYPPLVAEAAGCIGELYKNLAAEAPSEISKQHLMKSIQFFQKSQGLWLDLNNKFQVKQVRQRMPGL